MWRERGCEKRIVPKKWKRNDYRFNAIAKWKKRNFIILNNFKELYTEIL